MSQKVPQTPASQAELKALAARALAVRKGCLESIASLGVGHIGGSMSVVEALVALYFRHLRLDPADAKAADRDKIVIEPVTGA